MCALYSSCLLFNKKNFILLFLAKQNNKYFIKKYVYIYNIHSFAKYTEQLD